VHLVADEHAAGLERLVPIQPEIVATDRRLRLRRDGDGDGAPRRLRFRRRPGDVERDLARDAVNRQIADEDEVPLATVAATTKQRIIGRLPTAGPDPP
jgi:hypothetical protein